MSRSLSPYPEFILLKKGVQGLDSEFWIDMISRRSQGVSPARIKKVEHYKCTNGFNHEFLAVHLDHPAINQPIANPPASKEFRRDRQIVLFVERTAQPDILTVLGFSSTPLVAPIPASDLVSIASPKFKDPISHINEKHKEHILLSTLEFSGENRPTDRDLSSILQFATTKHPKYDIEYQCFWYAGLVFDALKDKFRGLKKDEHADRRGHLKTLKAPIGDGWAELKGEYEKWKSPTQSVSACCALFHLDS